jgi:hypothetical protein
MALRRRKILTLKWYSYFLCNINHIFLNILWVWGITQQCPFVWLCLIFPTKLNYKNKPKNSVMCKYGSKYSWNNPLDSFDSRNEDLICHLESQ